MGWPNSRWINPSRDPRRAALAYMPKLLGEERVIRPASRLMGCYERYSCEYGYICTPLARRLQAAAERGVNATISRNLVAQKLPAVHYYCTGSRRRGWLFGPVVCKIT